MSGNHLRPFEARYTEVAGGEVRGHRLVNLQEIQLEEGAGLPFVINMIRNATVTDELHLRRDDLTPKLRIVTAPSLLYKTEIWSHGVVKGFQIAKDASAAEPYERKLDGRRFAGGAIGLLLPSLPLAEGYEAEFPIFSSDLAATETDVYQRILVKGRGEIEAAGRTWLTWKVESAFVDAAGTPLMPAARTVFYGSSSTTTDRVLMPSTRRESVSPIHGRACGSSTASGRASSCSSASRAGPPSLSSCRSRPGRAR